MKNVVSFSGGKDSTAMLLMMLDAGEKIDDVVFFDGGWEFPEMYDHLEEVEERTGITIRRITPPLMFSEYLTERTRTVRRGKYTGRVIKGYGWPGFGTRWCTGKKQTALNKYFRQYREEGVIDCIGFAADEDRRIGHLHPNDWHRYRFPLVEWGVTEKDALRFCYDRGFRWSGVYEFTNRVSCWCCPLQSVRSLRNLRRYRPELWERLKEMQRALLDAHPEQKSHSWFHHQKSVFEMEERFLAEDSQMVLWD